MRQEFLSKKVEIEKATSNLLKKYKSRVLQHNPIDDTSSESSDEAKPLTLNKKFELQYAKDLQDLKAECNFNSESKKSEAATELLKTATAQTSKTTSKNLLDVLTFLEHHLFKIIHTKVSAHPNGFFAENVPLWYKKTFDKEIDPNWLDILKKSQQFYIENIQNKIVLYTKSDEDEAISDIDINAAGDIGKSGKINPANVKQKLGADTSVGFVRYKHLQKSLQDYAIYPNRKPSNKSADKNIAIKPISKSNVVKKSIKK